MFISECLISILDQELMQQVQTEQSNAGYDKITYY